MEVNNIFGTYGVNLLDVFHKILQFLVCYFTILFDF